MTLGLAITQLTITDNYGLLHLVIGCYGWSHDNLLSELTLGPGYCLANSNRHPHALEASAFLPWFVMGSLFSAMTPGNRYHQTSRTYQTTIDV